MLGRVAKYTPAYLVWTVIEGIIQGLLSSAGALFHFALLNSVGEGGDFIYAVKIIAFMAIFDIVLYAIDAWYGIIKNALIRRKLHCKMHEELFVKARSLDISCFDNPEFYNDFVWAMEQSDKRAVEVMDDTCGLITRLVSSFTMLGLLLTVDVVIAILLFVSSAVTIVCNLIGNKIDFQHSKEANPLWRKRSYINRIYHLSDYAKELRISRVDDILMNEYDRNNEQAIELSKKYGKKYFVFYSLGWNAVGTLTFFGILLYMIGLLNSGALLIGGFAATVTVVWNIRWTLTNLVERLLKFPKHSLYIEKYLEFLRYEPLVSGENKDIPKFESLEFRNVSFSYEFSYHPKYKFHDEDHKDRNGSAEKKEALKNVNLKLHAGEKIAIVGYNGAGKTTLIKLMMRLYDPDEGEVLYNGVNVKEYDPETYRRMIGTVFQDFKIYATSIAENVINGEYVEERDRDKVISALEMADFTEKLSSLKEGINTHLTREFNDEGTNLSGGEAQKIAIARVFAGDYPIVIMDEPSSALDPMAEYNLNQSILHHTDDKTVVFISHRLSTTRIADKIYMFDSGRLIEEGSHTELLERDGKYAEMFRLQSEKYKESYTAECTQ